MLGFVPVLTVTASAFLAGLGRILGHLHSKLPGERPVEMGGTSTSHPEGFNSSTTTGLTRTTTTATVNPHMQVHGIAVAPNYTLEIDRHHGHCHHPPLEGLRWHSDWDLAYKVGCLRHDGAEHRGYWLHTGFLGAEGGALHEVSFYDSVTGKKLFVAPRGRSFESFVRESREHGWLLFREEEAVQENVRALSTSEMVSVDGTHLGHVLPGPGVEHYSINIVSVSGPAPGPARPHFLQSRAT